MVRLEGIVLVAIQVFIALIPCENLVSTQATSLECHDVLTQATLEVSPLMLSELCKDNVKSSIVVTSGDTEWRDDVHGFCTSFDLNIGSLRMNHTLPEKALAIQLVKNDVTLDAAVVSNGGSSYQGSHLISVWGHQNTRFVLKIVPVCSSPPHPQDAKSSLTSPIFNPVITSERNNLNVAEKQGNGVRSPYGPLDLSQQLGSTVLSPSRDGRGDLNSHKAASRPNRLANMDSPRRRYRKKSDIAKDLRLAATQNANRNVSFPTTTMSMAKARLQWMEQKRLLFEEKVKRLRDKFPGEDLHETKDTRRVPDNVSHGNHLHRNNVGTSTKESKLVNNKTTFKYDAGEDAETQGVTKEKPRANQRTVNKRNSTGEEEIRYPDKVAPSGDEPVRIPVPLDLNGKSLNVSLGRDTSPTDENVEDVERNSSLSFGSSSLHLRSKDLSPSNTARVTSKQPPTSNSASTRDLDLLRQKAWTSENSKMDLTETLKVTEISQNEKTKDFKTMNKMHSRPFERVDPHPSTLQPINEFSFDTNVKVLKESHSDITITESYSSTNTVYSERDSIDEKVYLESPMYDLSISDTNNLAVISTQPVRFSDLHGSSIYSDISPTTASLEMETVTLQPSISFHSNTGDTFSYATISLTRSADTEIHSTKPTISLMPSALDSTNGLATHLTQHSAGSLSTPSIASSSNAQRSVIDPNMIGNPKVSLVHGILTQQPVSSHFDINSSPPPRSMSSVAQTEILSREQPRFSISPDTRQVSKIELKPSPLQQTSAIRTSASRSSAIVDTGVSSRSSQTHSIKDGPTLTPSFSAVSSTQKTSLRGNIASKSDLSNEDTSESSKTSSTLIKPSKPFEFMMSSDIHATLDIGRSTSVPHENDEEEDISSDTLWPVVAALVVGIPSIIVFGIAITVIHRRRLAQPAQASMITSSTLYPSI